MLSIVIPAYNEEARLPAALAEVATALPGAEVVVVDDGSRDRTAEVAASFGARVVRFPENRGKGAAVKAGILAASGDPILVMDADLAVPLECLPRLEEALAAGADIAVGSRGLPESVVIGRSPLRNLPGKAFNLAVRALTGLRCRDTQCGFKLFSRRAARAIFPLVSEAGYAFDVEVLLAARELGLAVAEAPVVWRAKPGSKVRVFRDGARMAAALLRITRARGAAQAKFRDRNGRQKTAPSVGQHGRLPDSHPWLAAKRLLVSKLLARFPPPGDRLLDIGCGGGWLWPGFKAWGADADPAAVEAASARLGGRAVLCDAARLPFPDGSFAAVLLLDVLEHLDDPLAALSEARRVLAPGGVIAATVPLHPWMRSRHDEECGHKRRCRPGELAGWLSAAGFSVEYRTCWNAAGFLPLALLRRLNLGVPDGASAPMRLAGRILAAEARLAARVPLLLGAAEAAVGRRA